MTIGLWILLFWAGIAGWVVLRRILWHWRGLAIIGGLLGLAALSRRKP
jgi:hypothetical protein